MYFIVFILMNYLFIYVNENNIKADQHLDAQSCTK